MITFQLLFKSALFYVFMNTTKAQRHILIIIQNPPLGFLYSLTRTQLLLCSTNSFPFIINSQHPCFPHSFQNA